MVGIRLTFKGQGYGTLRGMATGKRFVRQWFARILAFIRLGRYPFLAGGFILYGLGAAIAAYQGAQLDWAVYLWGQVIVTATQLMVHYANDYYDLAADHANHSSTMWSGGSRILVDGHLSPRIAQITAICCAFVALIGSSLLVVVSHNLVLFLLLFTAIILAWFYRGPPARLHSRGVGEMSSIFIASFLTPLTGYY